jgi:hypothetical protein
LSATGIFPSLPRPLVYLTQVRVSPPLHLGMGLSLLQS